MTTIRERTTLELPGPQAAVVQNRWWHIADVGVLGIWVTLVVFILRHHEPWADESQTWLIARDLDLKSIWFYELRYEGTPGLWHTILWIAQHVFHAPYGVMGVIGAICAALGVAFILWKAPFPRPLRYLLVFSYVIVYQYAVVARSYNLLPLLLFVTAYFYGDREHPGRMALALILLANVSLHGIVLAAAFGLCYLVEAIRNWPRLGETLWWRYCFCIGAVLLTFLFLFVILKPTHDMLMFAPDKMPASTRHAISLSRLGDAVDFAFFDQWLLSSLFLLAAAGWCCMRRKLLPFLLSVSLMILLFVMVAGRPHHHGTVFLAAIAGLWVAWPSEDEARSFTGTARLATNGMIALLVSLFCLNIWDAGVSMRNDYLYPYSGSEDAAKFLRQVGADKSTIFGYTYGMSAVQAYFNHDILMNIPTTYIHYGQPFYGFETNLDELQSVAPEYVILYSASPESDVKIVNRPLNRIGYRLVHFSDGHIFYKRTDFGAAAYLIYRRDGN
jgi:hypothetical protein